MNQRIYLDYAASTPVAPSVVDVMQRNLLSSTDFGNPSAVSHDYGLSAAAEIQVAASQVSNLLCCPPDALVWTSGATEADNLAILGAAEFYRDTRKHLITSRTEHRAVIAAVNQLEARGYRVTWLEVDSQGRIDPEHVLAALCPDTFLVSIMHANNETGVLQDIATIGAYTRAQQVMFHVDAAQTVGKIPIDLRQLPVDLLSVSAHKLYGPKGIGALFVQKRPRARIKPCVLGGGQQKNLRSGTLPTHQILGLGEAAALAGREMLQEATRIAQLRSDLWQGLSRLPHVICQTPLDHSLYNILSVSFAGVDGESLMLALDKIAVSGGAACNSQQIAGSHVLAAMGVDPVLAHATIRFSLGRMTTQTEIDITIAHVNEQVTRLRQLSPCWQ